MNYRFILMMATLLPMIFYYLQLGFAPKTLATYFVMGIPGSIFWGVFVMLWGVLMAIFYLIIHQKNVCQPQSQSSIQSQQQSSKD